MIDTHAHLANLSEIDNLVKRAKASHIEHVIDMSTTLLSSKSTIKLSEKYQGFVLPALGVHPTEYFSEDIESCLDYVTMNAHRIVAIGEIGLDYWHKLVKKNKVERERQTLFYSSLLDKASEVDLPVSIHSRGAWRDCLTLALKHGHPRGVFHWYSGPLDVLDEVIDAGFYVSCTPAVEYSIELRAAMSRAPIEKILVETDTPVYIKTLGRCAEPSDITSSIMHLATLKDLNTEDVSKTTAGNARKLFGL